MTIRNVTKNFAGMEDLLTGVGTVEQVRNENAVTMGRVDVPYAVSSVAEMQALDVTRFVNARVYSSATEWVEYRYDANDVTGILPISGSGSWIIADIRNDLISSNGTSKITHTQSGTDYNLAAYLQNRYRINIKDSGAVGDGTTNNGTISSNRAVIPEGSFVFNETVFTTNDTVLEGSGILINNNVDEHIIALGEKQSGADAKYSYQSVTGLTFSSSSVDTDDNWALVNSSADFTKYLGNLVKDSYVGLSFNKNYNYSVAADSAVSNGTIVGNTVKCRFMGIEHFATANVATAGNSIEGTAKAGPGFRFTGDLATPSYGNGLNAASDCSKGLTAQTQTIANCLVGYALTDCTNGIDIPENTTIPNGSSRHNIFEATVDDCVYGAFLYNTQYNWIRVNVNNASSQGIREEDTTGASGIGDLKSNKIDALITNSAAGATLKGSHNEISINASDITTSCLIIDGDHNNVKLICDKANIGASTNRSLILNGTHNLVEVVSTNNTAVGASGDILIAGNKNDVRVMTDATVRLSGNNNVIRGFAASTIDVGTSNDVTGVLTY